MGETVKHLSRRLKQILFFTLAIFLAFFVSVLLLPVILVLTLIGAVMTWFFISQRQSPKKKGDVEILPAEKTYKSTKDEELEITIDALQRKHGKQIEPPIKPPSDSE